MKPADRPAEEYRLIETRLQKRLPGGVTQCGLCPWRCRLTHGQRGFCQAHVNRYGTLYNLAYGIISSINIDPIEEKPVRHFRPGTRVLSVGSYGCNFRCGGCHNLEISWGVTALDELARGASTEAWISPETLVAAALDRGVDGVAFTYSEPAIWLEYVLDACALARKAGLYTVFVSNSFTTPEALDLAAPLVDVLCSDIKSLHDEFYREICPTADVGTVLGAIETAHRLGIHVETRTNVIPGKNDAPDELYRIACWIRDHLGPDSPWHITRFFPAYKLSGIETTPDGTLERAWEEGRRAGLRHIHLHRESGCDCAAENPPLGAFLPESRLQPDRPQRCGASCCGEEGILLKKYE